MTSEKPDDAPDWWDDVDEGTRQDATVNSEPEREYIRADGKGYWFDVIEPSWKKRNEIISDNINVTESGMDLSIDGYYLDILEYMIEDSNVAAENIRTFLIGVNAQLGDKLEDLAPDPGESLTEEEEGNSVLSSEESTADEAPTDSSSPSVES
jgi:hypothetical protein